MHSTATEKAEFELVEIGVEHEAGVERIP